MRRLSPNAPPDWRIRKRAEILDKLAEFKRRTGRAPTSPELGNGRRERRVHWLPSHEMIRRHFGSVAEALLAAGLTPRRQGDRLTDRRVGRRDPDGIRLSRKPFIVDPRWPAIVAELTAELRRRGAA